MFRRVCLAGLILLFLGLPLMAKAADEAETRLVVLTLNATSLQEIKEANLPFLNALLRDNLAAVGLMNARPAKASYASTSGYLTLGTGAKAEAGEYGSLAFNENENFFLEGNKHLASEWYKQATGYNLKNGQVLSLAVADASRLSASYDYPLNPGLLGKQLAKSGIKTAVIGNADSVDGYHREAALIAMNTTGKTDYGDVSSKEKSKQDYRRLLSKVKYYLGKARFVVVELGQVSELDYRRAFMPDKRYKTLKQQALKNADAFLGQLVRQLNLKTDMVVIVSPTPSQLSQKQKNYLTPVFVIRDGQHNMLFSQSTKWPGIIDNLDFAPTVLEFFSLPKPAAMVGSPLESKPGSGSVVNELLKQEKTAVGNMNTRLPLLTGYVVLIIAGIILSVLMFFLTDIKAAGLRFVEGFLLFLLCVPPVLLLFSLISYANPWVLILGAPLASILITFALLLLFRKLHWVLFFLMASTASLVIADIISGSFLMRNSVLGFSPIVGARFYGLGNEYMGVIIGTVILGLCLLSDIQNLNKRFVLMLAIAVFALVTFVIGFPGLGANVGGALAASVGSISTVFFLSGKRFTWRQPVILVSSLIGVVSVIMLSDKILGIQTHAGKAGELAANGSFAQLLLIFKRKILANLKLVRYTAWTNVLITILVISPILFIKPAGAIKRFRERMPTLWAGVVGLSLGSIAAFLFNDSGVVAAATSMLYVAVVVLYVIIDEQKQALIDPKR